MAISHPHLRPTVPGLQQVTFVRITRDPGGAAEAVGIRHRHPATVRISPDRARELAARGVPVVRRTATPTAGETRHRHGGTVR